MRSQTTSGAQSSPPPYKDFGYAPQTDVKRKSDTPEAAGDGYILDNRPPVASSNATPALPTSNHPAGPTIITPADLEAGIYVKVAGGDQKDWGTKTGSFFGRNHFFHPWSTHKKSGVVHNSVLFLYYLVWLPIYVAGIGIVISGGIIEVIFASLRHVGMAFIHGAYRWESHSEKGGLHWIILGLYFIIWSPFIIGGYAIAVSAGLIEMFGISIRYIGAAFMRGAKD